MKNKNTFLKDWWDSNSKKQKNLWVSSIFLFFILASSLFTIIMVFETNEDYITKTQCNIQISEKVSYALSLQEENDWLALLYNFSFVIKFLFIAIAIAWILHGVGFHLIKR